MLPCHRYTWGNAERRLTVQRRDVCTCDRPRPAAVVAADSQSRLQIGLATAIIRDRSLIQNNEVEKPHVEGSQLSICVSVCRHLWHPLPVSLCQCMLLEPSCHWQQWTCPLRKLIRKLAIIYCYGLVKGFTFSIHRGDKLLQSSTGIQMTWHKAIDFRW